MIQNKYVIGIVGGVGAGKSTVLNYISAFYQVEVIMADDVGHDLMRPGKRLFYAITEAYGEGILTEDKQIDTKKLAGIAFKDEESQKKINDIEHPIIKEEIEKAIVSSEYEIIFLEAALLIEGGLKELCDEIWLISAPLKVRIERLMASRGYSEEKCRSIIALQKTDQEFKKYCTLVLTNAKDLERMKEEADYYMSSLMQDLRKDLRKY